MSVEVPGTYGFATLMVDGRHRNSLRVLSMERIIAALPISSSKAELVSALENASFADHYPFTPSSYSIGLDKWILQDENYPNFELRTPSFDKAKGRKKVLERHTYPFALYFSPSNIREVETKENTLWKTPSKENTYIASGEVIWKSDFFVIANFGSISAYMAHSNPFKGIGERFTCDLRLSLDPFYYFEEISKISSSPALIYDWEIQRITAEKIEYDKVINDSFDSYHPRRVSLVPKSSEFFPVEKTSIDGDFDHYILKSYLCSLARKTLTATPACHSLI